MPLLSITELPDLVGLPPQAPADDPAWRDILGTMFDPEDGGAETYALVDACKWPGLPETLDASGLTYRCLFQGKAQEELGEAAPWLVQLTPDATFCRWLWTDDRENDVPWHLWGRDAAVILRSPVGFDRLHAHLRRKIRILDMQGNALYFRFWDPFHLMTFVSSAAATEADKLWLLSDQQGGVVSQLICSADDRSFRVDMPPDLPACRSGFRLSDPLRAAFVAAVAARAQAHDIAAVQKLFPRAPADLLGQERAQLIALGFRQPAPIRAALCLCAHRKAAINALPEAEREILNATRQSDQARIRLLHRAAGNWPQPDAQP
ncbi:DUF4123 domain-containing protein [uncultured Litoreibacter sp.]|uniref:DUF4123 domain-containing protein n=1 Tax=uncultured Litoreibacter sp. TaxID=1392394 RepID=UPI0026116B83|nr:DUF4123 domain-containing protein [uncultured Litoreibacter sp.]